MIIRTQVVRHTATLFTEETSMDVQWWYWLIAAGVLIVAELVMPAFFVFWFGLGALLVSAALWAVPTLSFATQLVIWAVASVLMVFVWFRFFRKEQPASNRWTMQEYVGEPGILLTPADAFTKGRVQFSRAILGSQEWTCICSEPLEEGTRVTLVEIHGNVVKVR
jgi:membrane protein implicated in regulation of membrane protease activity